MNDSIDPRVKVGQPDSSGMASKPNSVGDTRSTNNSLSSLDANDSARGTELLTAATLASMGYLHSIALAVAAGVFATIGAVLGALSALVFSNELIAIVFIVLGGIISIGMLSASIVALLRADVDKDKARGNQGLLKMESIPLTASKTRPPDYGLDSW